MDTVQLSGAAITAISLVALWDLVWKGFALWKAGRSNDKLWFILLLIFNTAGILPIVYIFVVNKGKSTKKEQN